MGDRRKLQAEIDRCLKRINEGTADFEEIWQKVQSATNANQKEKFEADLKKEIKKLQRLRDQIKTWMQSNDIKDKRPLQDARKLIETHMERFKVMERDTKTKAYSKEGLCKDPKMDPKEQAKEEMSENLSDMVDQLTLQVEQFEAEVEQIKLRNVKKKDRDKVDKIEEIATQIARHRFYMSHLEMLKRMLENDTVEPDEIRAIEDTLKDYIENSTEPGFIEDEGVFEVFDFEANLDIPATGAENLGSGVSTSSKNEDEDASTTSSQITSPSPRKGSSSGTSAMPATISTSSKTLVSTTTSSPATNSSASNHSTLHKPTAVKPSAVSNSTHPPPVSPSATSTSTQQSLGPSSMSKIFGNSPANYSGFSTAITPSTPNSTTKMSNFVGGVGYSAVASSNTAPVQPANQNSNPSSNEITPRSSNLTPTMFSSSNKNSTAGNGPDRSISAQGEKLHDSSAMVSKSSTDTYSPSIQAHLSQQSSTGFQPPLSYSSSGNSDIDPFTNGMTSTTAESGGGSNLVDSSDSFSSASSNIHLNQTAPFNPYQSQLDSTFGETNTNLSGNSGGVSNKDISSNYQPNPFIFPHTSTTTNSAIKGDITNSANNAPITTPTSGYPYTSTMSSLNLTSNPSSTVVSAVADNYGGNKASFPSSTETQGGLSGDIKDSVDPISGLGVVPVPPDAAYLDTIRRPPEEQYRTETNIPPLLGVAPLGPVKLGKEHVYQQDMLEAAFEHLPHASDSERLRPYLPRNPCPTPSYYPKEPLPASDTVDFFEKLATETLFFIFYYLEGTEAQYLAAKALKKQSWRFHTKYMMWFQRHEEPKQITDDCEMGSYIYFDYEKWTQRRKEGFTFEYRFLEDRDLK